MSTAADKAKHVLTGASYAITALEAIGELAGRVFHNTSTVNAYVDALEAIDVAVKAVMGALDGSGAITHETVEQAIADLRAKLASNDAAADAALDQRFPK